MYFELLSDYQTPAYLTDPLKLTRMRVLCRAAELIPAKSAERKSKDQRMPSGDAIIPAAFPSRFNPDTMLPGQPERQTAGSGKKREK